MINEIKSEIAFLKDHHLEKEVWKETPLDLIKRLTSNIKAHNKEQKSKLIEEVRDFIAKGKGNDDSFDFVTREDKKFYKEIHIYRHKNKVVARIDRTMDDGFGKHTPFENFVTIEYDEDSNEKIQAKKINILGLEYVPYPANLIFAEKLFSHIAGEVVDGKNHDRKHYDGFIKEIAHEVPDIFASDEQKEKDKEIAEENKYKIWKKEKGLDSDRKLHKEDLSNNIIYKCLIQALEDSDLNSIDTDGLTEEDILKNLVSKIQLKNDELSKELKRQAKEFLDPNYGNDSFNMEKKLKDGALIYSIDRDRKNNKIDATIRYMQKGKRKTKHTYMFDIIHMIYDEDENNPGEFVLYKMYIMGKNYPVTKQWEWLGERFYNYLLFELQLPDDNSVNLNNMGEVLDILENRWQDHRYIGNEYLEERKVLLDDKFEDKDERYERLQKEEQLRIKKKYEELYKMDLKPL
ncbi:MAG: hypothetical protein N4A43_00015 [Alphaproteobacteria bacterium]|jgi:hypothetical protein|nr:hypothetical protein [Alphaproteobacteria bacterium]